MTRSQNKAANMRTLVPQAGISVVLQKERRYLHQFFAKLAEADIIDMGDLQRYTEQELFSVAPTSPVNRQRFMRYVDQGLIDLKPD